MTRDIKYPVPRVVVSTLEYVDDFFFFFETPFDTVEEGWHVSGRIQGLGLSEVDFCCCCCLFLWL